MEVIITKNDTYNGGFVYTDALAHINNEIPHNEKLSFVIESEVTTDNVWVLHARIAITTLDNHRLVKKAVVAWNLETTVTGMAVLSSSGESS